MDSDESKSVRLFPGLPPVTTVESGPEIELIRSELWELEREKSELQLFNHSDLCSGQPILIWTNLYRY